MLRTRGIASMPSAARRLQNSNSGVDGSGTACVWLIAYALPPPFTLVPSDRKIQLASSVQFVQLKSKLNVKLSPVFRVGKAPLPMMQTAPEMDELHPPPPTLLLDFPMLTL